MTTDEFFYHLGQEMAVITSLPKPENEIMGKHVQAIMMETINLEDQDLANWLILHQHLEVVQDIFELHREYKESGIEFGYQA